MIVKKVCNDIKSYNYRSYIKKHQFCFLSRPLCEAAYCPHLHLPLDVTGTFQSHHVIFFVAESIFWAVKMVSTMIDSIHCRVDRGEKSLPILDEV
jgi:hypothetical protein